MKAVNAIEDVYAHKATSLLSRFISTDVLRITRLGVYLPVINGVRSLRYEVYFKTKYTAVSYYELCRPAK